MKTFKAKIKCPSCSGTGIYAGMAERDGLGVECHTCKGTGCQTFVHHYEDFVKRVPREDIVKVIPRGTPFVLSPELLGDNVGIPYDEWDEGDRNYRGREPRGYTCPALWYRGETIETAADASVEVSGNKDIHQWCQNGKKGPGWGSSYTECPLFKSERCWAAFDRWLLRESIKRDKT